MALKYSGQPCTLCYGTLYKAIATIDLTLDGTTHHIPVCPRHDAAVRRLFNRALTNPASITSETTSKTTVADRDLVDHRSRPSDAVTPPPPARNRPGRKPASYRTPEGVITPELKEPRPTPAQVMTHDRPAPPATSTTPAAPTVPVPPVPTTPKAPAPAQARVEEQVAAPLPTFDGLFLAPQAPGTPTAPSRVTRPAPPPVQPTPRSTTSPSFDPNDIDMAHVRSWAKDNGYQVGSRGRIDTNILKAYIRAMTAHPVK